ncbi:unnamed protein product [Prunus armeniaca]|uniref:Uncharacterized protein n=1 Tax=Prunus armeniaca TaxID=36596 RepID=A0A6J5UQK9_PRUAR|nr:unnamed protein product [Prunus armeniaca]
MPPTDSSCPSHPLISPAATSASRFSHTYTGNPNRSPLSASLTHSMVTLAKIGICKPNPKYAYHALVNKHKEWCLAMTDEFNALLRAGTWNLVPCTPL